MTATIEPEPEPEPYNPVTFTKSLAGIAGPLDYFDPAGFCAGDVSEGKVRFIREAEIKHGRVAMLAALGFLVAENFHPLFGGGINVPSYVAFQQTPLQTFWPITMMLIGVVEVFSVLTYQSPFDGKWWTLKATHTP